jgi:hypothetical protein
MRRISDTYLIVSLTILVALSVALFFFGREESRPEIKRDYFKAISSEKVDHVSLQSPSGSVDLKFENRRWRVNDKWDADMQMIKLLFATLSQTEVRRPVANNIKDSIAQKLSETGTRVQLFEGEQVVHDFMAGGNEAKTESWFMKAGEQQPYVVMIPGYRVYVSGIVELDASGWRNKRIFDFNWRNFRSLRATYSREQAQDFEIEMKGTYFGIKNLQKVDTAKLNTYLDAVSLLFATRFIPNGKPLADSLAKAQPAARIEIRDIADRTYSIELFTPRKKDTEVFGRTADGEIVALSKNAVAEIVRRRDYFKE